MAGQGGREAGTRKRLAGQQARCTQGLLPQACLVAVAPCSCCCVPQALLPLALLPQALYAFINLGAGDESVRAWKRAEVKSALEFA